MTTHRWIVPTALLVSLGMLAAACGSDNSGSSGATTAAPAATTAAAAAGTTTSAAASGATTTAAAGAQGGVIPDKGTGKYGQDATNKNLYVGPGGFNIDVTK